MFGLAHKVQSPKIRDACVKEYPGILTDIQGEDRGLTSLMCDHLIDLDHFVEPSVVKPSVVEPELDPNQIEPSADSETVP